MRPLITTWGFNNGMHSEFIWQGTMDYAPMLSLTMAVKTFNWLGGIENVVLRNQKLAKWCVKMLVKVWNTQILTDMFSSMVSIEVPPRVSQRTCGKDADSCQLSSLHDELYESYNIEVPVFTFMGKKYIRVSICSYNTAEDCFRLAGSLLKCQGYDDSYVGFKILQCEMENYQIYN